MRSSDIDVTTIFSPDIPKTMVDNGQLQQVFLNIILNAKQAMSEASHKGKLTIETNVDKSESNIIITFKDNGPGIEKENLDRIFDPFFSTKEAGKGTGLGLSICYGIIKEHNGKIYVRSSAGKGATFTIELPVIAEQDQHISIEATEVEPVKITSGRILVIDDEPSVCEFLNDALTQEGYSVSTVNTAVSALEQMKSDKYDLIMLDIKMPEMDGIALHEHLLYLEPSLKNKIVFITGDTVSPDTKDYLDKTEAICITKPFDLNSLKDDINKILSYSM
jgi:CheY-like chemotaxis protein